MDPSRFASRMAAPPDMISGRSNAPTAPISGRKSRPLASVASIMGTSGGSPATSPPQAASGITSRAQEKLRGRVIVDSLVHSPRGSPPWLVP